MPEAFIITRIQVGDYDAWRPMFDQDRPRAREKARTQRVFRGVEDPDHVFIVLEFESVDTAQEARRRLLDSGVLDRFEDKHGPNVVVEAA
jgi:histidinol-phosphate/aromatic aminotransferase/cobyric acid decarboxylase-like protein